MEALIFKQLAAIQKEIQPIAKGSKNVQQNFNFRGVEDVYNSLHDLFAKHEVVTMPETIGKPVREERQSKNGGLLLWTVIEVKFTFYATDGSHVSATVTGEGMDSGDKGINKAMSVAHKYCLTQMFTIPFKDMPDPDKESPQPAPKQVAKPTPADGSKPVANDAIMNKLIEKISAGGIGVVNKAKEHYVLTEKQVHDLLVAELDFEAKNDKAA